MYIYIYISYICISSICMPFKMIQVNLHEKKICFFLIKIYVKICIKFNYAYVYIIYLIICIYVYRLNYLINIFMLIVYFFILEEIFKL